MKRMVKAISFPFLVVLVLVSIVKMQKPVLLCPDKTHSVCLTEAATKMDNTFVVYDPTEEETQIMTIEETSQSVTDVTETTTVLETTTVFALPEPKWNGTRLTACNGTVIGPSGKETYYNLPMQGVVRIMRGIGNNDEYWVRKDGVKMLGSYVMVAANLNVRPRGTILETSLGTGIVCDTGRFAETNPTQIDIAVTW